MIEQKNSLRIGVLMGGLSPEKNISIKSGKAVAQALRSRGWNTIEIDVDRNLPTQLLENKIDLAWIALHGVYGEDGCVQGVLELMGIPYTGSNVQACAISMDKEATKRMLQKSKVQLIPDRIIQRDELVHEDMLDLLGVALCVLERAWQSHDLYHNRIVLLCCIFQVLDGDLEVIWIRELVDLNRQLVLPLGCHVVGYGELGQVLSQQE